MKIAIPSLEEQHANCLSEIDICDFYTVREATVAKILESAASGHGAKYPRLDKDTGLLPKTTCSGFFFLATFVYCILECGRTFRSRTALFEHIKEFYPLMKKGLHANHFNLKPPYAQVQDEGRLILCAARSCGFHQYLLFTNRVRRGVCW